MSTEKTFTQADVNRIVQERLAEEKNKKSAGDAAEVTELKQAVATLQAQLSQQEQEKQAAAKAKDLETRFATVTKDKKWANEYARAGAFSDWQKALENSENANKSDADIYTAVTKDTPGLYKGVQSEPFRLAGAGSGTPSGDSDALRGAFGLK